MSVRVQLKGGKEVTAALETLADSGRLVRREVLGSSLAIQKEAKQIMDKFAAKLEKVKLPEAEGVKRQEQTRKETKASCKKEFRKAFFENAPNKEGGWIKAEKGGWK